MSSFDNFFARVGQSRIPNFSSGFSDNLRNVLDDIDTNFQRILSAPFLQGDPGKSVIKSDTPLYTNTGTGEFSQFGKEFIRVLYNGELDNDIDEINTYNQLKDFIDTYLQDSDITDGVYSCEYINPDQDLENRLTSVDCYMIDPSPETDGERTFIPFVFFIDMRIAAMQQNQQAFGDNTDFVDRSCVLYGRSISNPNSSFDWDISRYQIMPTLYWDSNVQQWCWSLNGMETGVTAQGVQGETGPMIKIWVANGVRYTAVDDEEIKPRVYLSEILCNNQDPQTPYTIDAINDGDLVFAWFKEDHVSDHIEIPVPPPALNEITNFTIGLAQKSGTNVYVLYSNFYDFRTITDDVVLRTQLNEIGCDYDNTDLANLRGLYVGADGKRLGSAPAPGDYVHYMYGTKTNNVENFHITPTEYSYTYPKNTDLPLNPGIDSDEIAPFTWNSLLCMDYRGIRAIPVTPSASNYFYELDFNTSNNIITESILGPHNLDQFKVTLLQNYPSEYKRSEIGLAISKAETKEDPSEYIFLGGEYGDDYLLANRYAYSGIGLEFDRNPAIQVIKEKQNIQDESNFGVGRSCDRDMWNSLFNYAPSLNRDKNASYLNFSYRRHMGLSIPSEQHELSLCFTPKVEIVNETTSRKWLRIYLPTVGYMRDATPRSFYKRRGDDGSAPRPYAIPNVYNPHVSYEAPIIDEPNWAETGGLSIKNSDLDRNININQNADLYNFSSNADNELFLYDRIKFLVDENKGSNLPTQAFQIGKSAHGLKGDTLNPTIPVTEQGWEESSAMKLLSGWKPMPIVSNPGPYLEKRYTEAPVRATKYNEYFDILLSGEEPDNTSSWFGKILLNPINNIFNSYCYCNVDGAYNQLNTSERWFNFIPLLKFKLEKPLILSKNNNTTYKLADELYMSCIVAKGIQKTVDQGYNISDIEFSLLFTDPSRFDNNGNNRVIINNDKSIIKHDSYDYVGNGNYVSLKKYNGRGNYFDHIANLYSYDINTLLPIKDTLAINFVVRVKWHNLNEWEILSINPSSNSSDGHAEFSNDLNLNNFVLDRWIMSDDFIDNGNEGGPQHPDRYGNSNFYESFSWWMVNNLWYKESGNYSNKNNYYNYIGLDPNKMISADRFYFSPNSSTDQNTPTVWTNNPSQPSPTFDYEYDYTRYYDFYEMEMSNTRFGSKPRRPEIPSLTTGEFTVKDREGDENVHSFKLNYLYTKHSWESWQLDEQGTISSRNPGIPNDIPFDFINFIGSAMESSARSLGMSEETNLNLEDVVNQLQEDDINVTMPSSEMQIRNNFRNEIR